MVCGALLGRRVDQRSLANSDHFYAVAGSELSRNPGVFMAALNVHNLDQTIGDSDLEGLRQRLHKHDPAAFVFLPVVAGRWRWYRISASEDSDLGTASGACAE